jgi:hypothetical protein
MVFTARSQVEEVEICRLSGISCLSGSTEALCLLSRAGLSLLVLTCMVHSFRFDGPDPLHRIEPRWIVFGCCNVVSLVGSVVRNALDRRHVNRNVNSRLSTAHGWLLLNSK